ncbi:MAG: hypothetical protein COW78_02925 [Bdellovibrio sp. CG22_combo_CG10-13_8_21_14_all_39_27]|nr:MAG: hypothetical protein COW78_02925 [Bdellovibrio sp. CG22_combo_CG10-13_8_21_14_all_39_27]
MNKLMKLILPFMKYINIGIGKALTLTIIINLGLIILFNPKPEDIYASVISLYTFIGIILSLVYSKQIMGTNISWMLSLPYSKLKLIGINLLISIYSYFAFFISIIVLAFISYFISYKTFHLDWPSTIEFSFSDIVTGLSNAYAKLNVQVLAGLNACILLILGISISIQNTRQINVFTQLNNQNLRFNPDKQRSIQILLGVAFVLLLFAMQIDKLFSPMNIIFVISLMSAAIWKSTCVTIIDESKRAKIILYSILAYVIISNSTFAIMTYNYSLDSQNPILKRIDAYHYLGLFAPSIEQELQDELNKSSSNNVDIDLLLAVDGQDPTRLLKSILKAPYQKKNFDTFKQDQKIIYQLDANQVDLAEFMSDKASYHFTEKLKYINFSHFENTKAIKFLNDYSLKYKYFNYDLCWHVSHKKLSEDEIKIFLNADQPMPRYCGLILSRYYPTYDLTDSLIKAASNKEPLEYQSLFITISLYQGALAKIDELYQLSAKNFSFKKVDCPGDSSEFIKQFNELSYSQQIKCPRFYLARNPINAAGMDSIEYISNPKVYFEPEAFENSAQQRSKAP